MNKLLIKILAVIGALAAVAAVLYFFRDKLAALCKGCKSQEEGPKEADTVEDFVEEAKAKVTEAVEEAKDKAAEIVEEAKDKAAEIVETAEEKAAAIKEEFKDYADVEQPTEE